MNDKNWLWINRSVTIVFGLAFVFLVAYFVMNVEKLKNNPCQMCIENYGLDCYSMKDKSIHLYKGYDWNGTERKKLLEAQLNNQSWIQVTNYSFIQLNESV
jgi:hypothetical protein